MINSVVSLNGEIVPGHSKSKDFSFKMALQGAGEVAPWLRAFAALAPWWHTEMIVTAAPGGPNPLWLLWAASACGTQPNMRAHTRKIKTRKSIFKATHNN